MTSWEYLVDSAFARSLTTSEMNSYGREGWEMVSETVYRDTDGQYRWRYVFKRAA